MRLLSAAVKGVDGAILEVPRRDEEFVVELRFLVRDRIPALSVAFVLETSQGVRVLDEDWGQDTGQELVPRTLPAGVRGADGCSAESRGGGLRARRMGGFGSRDDRPAGNPLLQPLARTRDSAEAAGRARIVQPGVSWDVEAVESSEETP